jgi:hypothetical protein
MAFHILQTPKRDTSKTIFGRTGPGFKVRREVSIKGTGAFCNGAFPSDTLSVSDLSA